MALIGGSFLFTGEVLGQRPMSQHSRALRIIDRDSGLGDIIVRPLSAQHLPPSKPERDGLIDRGKLLAISGRSRKVQIGLAEEFGFSDYPCPAGGRLLTDAKHQVAGQRFRFWQSISLDPPQIDIEYLRSPTSTFPFHDHCPVTSIMSQRYLFCCAFGNN